MRCKRFPYLQACCNLKWLNTLCGCTGIADARKSTQGDKKTESKFEPEDKSETCKSYIKKTGSEQLEPQRQKGKKLKTQTKTANDPNLFQRQPLLIDRTKNSIFFYICPTVILQKQSTHSGHVSIQNLLILLLVFSP